MQWAYPLPLPCLLALAIYYPTRSFYPILQPMWQAMCHSPGSTPFSQPSGIDQWTYSWPQNFGTGHKLHKTKPNQTGQAAEEAAMKCIAMRLSFISCGQRAGGGGAECGGKGANLCHTYSDFRFPQHVPRPIRECVILAAVEKGIIAKVNSRQNGQWLWLWPTYWAKISNS